jgi:hypothetical protein
VDVQATRFVTNSKSKLSLLKIYRQLLVEVGRFDEAKAPTEKIDKVDDPSPYGWLELADLAYTNKKLSEALL